MHHINAKVDQACTKSVLYRLNYSNINGQINVLAHGT